MNVRIDTSNSRARIASMSTRTKRTYNLSPEAVAHVRDLAARGDLGPARTPWWRWRSSSYIGRFGIAKRPSPGRGRPVTRVSGVRCGHWRRSWTAAPGGRRNEGPAVGSGHRGPRASTVGNEQQGRRRALVVSHEAFHASGMATVCPISARESRYPGEVAIPSDMPARRRMARSSATRSARSISSASPPLRSRVGRSSSRSRPSGRRCGRHWLASWPRSPRRRRWRGVIVEKAARQGRYWVDDPADRARRAPGQAQTAAPMDRIELRDLIAA